LRDVKVYRERLGLPAEKFLIGDVGLFRTMGKEKGIKVMIDSLVNLGHDCVMVFVGGKDEEIEYYKKYAMEKKVIERCLFLPIQPFSKVVLYEQVMDILVIPYPDSPHFRKYGFPMKIYEYMASGVPIVYTKLDLLEEIVSDCAFGVEADNPQELAKVLEQIKSNYGEAKSMASLALDKVSSLDWNNKAKSIITASAIIPGMLIIPNKALSYILFQRTEFSIYQSYPKLLRIVMNKRVPIYNMAIKLEALLLSNRTKRLFSLDMEKEIDTIKQYLPSEPKKILDIGCGVAGIDIMLNKYYSEKGVRPEFYLLDKSQVNSRVYYGFERQAAYYNSLDIAKELLVSNGVKRDLVHLQEVSESKIFPDSKFDLVVSLISWGFHYPVSTYLDQVYDLLNNGGRLIIDVRKESGGEKLLESKFGSIQVIFEARKHRRILAIKK
jgi:SAM-dependent methyltransferase